MTEVVITSSDVLHGQFADVLIDVPVTVLAKLSDREKFIAFDWVDTVREKAARMQFVPVIEIASIRRCLTAEQLAGQWGAFTTWRPVKVSRGLFD